MSETAPPPGEVIPPDQALVPKDDKQPLGKSTRERSGKAREKEEHMSPEVALAELLAKGNRADEIIKEGSKAAGILLFQFKNLTESLLGERSGQRTYVDQLQTKLLEAWSKLGELTVKLAEAEAAAKGPMAQLLEGIQVAQAAGELPLVKQGLAKLMKFLGLEPPKEEPVKEMPVQKESLQMETTCPNCGTVIVLEE